MSASQHRADLFWSLRKLVVAVFAAVFLTFAGSGAAYALWSASATVSGSASTGTVTVTLATSNLNDIAFGNDLTPATGSFTVHNTSTADGNVTVSLDSSVSNASNFGVSMWPKPADTDCGSSITPSTGGTSWATASVARPLAADASATYCVRTFVSDRGAVASPSGTISSAPSITATLNVHDWKGTASATAHIATNQIFPIMTPSIGDKYIHGGQCVLVTDGTDSGTIQAPAGCPSIQTMPETWQVQNRGGGYYQFVVADSDLCMQATDDGTALTSVTCAGTPAQQFTLEAAEPITFPSVVPIS